jgi:hypothetical protein
LLHRLCRLASPIAFASMFCCMLLIRISLTTIAWFSSTGRRDNIYCRALFRLLDPFRCARGISAFGVDSAGLGLPKRGLSVAAGAFDGVCMCPTSIPTIIWFADNYRKLRGSLVVLKQPQNICRWAVKILSAGNRDHNERKPDQGRADSADCILKEMELPRSGRASMRSPRAGLWRSQNSPRWQRGRSAASVGFDPILVRKRRSATPLLACNVFTDHACRYSSRRCRLIAATPKRGHSAAKVTKFLPQFTTGAAFSISATHSLGSTRQRGKRDPAISPAHRLSCRSRAVSLRK